MRYARNLCYRVLHAKDGQINTWDYPELNLAERAYWALTNFDKAMIMQVWSNNVKCVHERNTNV